MLYKCSCFIGYLFEGPFLPPVKDVNYSVEITEEKNNTMMNYLHFILIVSLLDQQLAIKNFLAN